MPKHWTAEERNTLKDLLTNGVELNALHVALPDRTAPAISREATKFGFSTKTEDGVKVLFDNIKRRKRISKTKSVKDEVSIEAGKSIIMSSNDTPATAERFENKSAVIVAENNLVCDTCVATKISVLHANKLAIDILSTYHISMSPTTIAELSNQILNSIKDL